MRFWLSVWNNRKRSAPVFCLCGAHTIHTHSTSSQKPFAAPSEAKTHSLSQASTSFAMELRLGLLSFLSLLQAMALSLSLTHSLHLWFSTEQFFFKSNSMTAFYSYSSSFSRFRGCNSNRVCLCVCLFFFFFKNFTHFVWLPRNWTGGAISAWGTTVKFQFHLSESWKWGEDEEGLRNAWIFWEWSHGLRITRLLCETRFLYSFFIFTFNFIFCFYYLPYKFFKMENKLETIYQFCN